MQQGDNEYDVSTAETTRKIIDRLPGFYRAREKNSVLHNFADAFAKTISGQQYVLSNIAKSHWVRTANGSDLDRLGALIALERKPAESDDDFRARISNTFTDFKRGVTVEAIRTQLASYLCTSVDDIIVVENPRTEMRIERKATSGDVWNMSSMSINDEDLTIIISLDDGEARDPTIIDTTNKLAFKYNGTLKKGQKLEIRNGAAKLDGIEVSKDFLIEEQADSHLRVDPTSSRQTKVEGVPKLWRKPSKWTYKEKLTDTVARCDESKFDESIFYKYVTPSTLTFAWAARSLAAIEVKVPARLLEKNSLSKADLEKMVNAIRAAGVRSSVTLTEDMPYKEKRFEKKDFEHGQHAAMGVQRVKEN